jgi:Fe-S-cluster containining protein
MQLSRPIRRRIKQIYKKVNPKAELCKKSCYACCNDPWIFYIEFAYLVSEFSKDELEKIFSRPKELIKEETSSKHGQIIRQGSSRLLMIDPNKLGNEKEDHYCPMLEDGKCLAYEMRPWICRSYQMNPGTGTCMMQYHTNLATSISSSLKELIAENNAFAPSQFSNKENRISEWYKILN